ncbi:Hypothetical protein CINCED_3A009117 [Cinara cedri]|uniref:Uncharacterized protein n=1 Tax=Cinara cedri TaxID=506608 RepID=A0A5E4MFE7_9HEMI|nr:Hypothetical protein CINCED_3A009117 [Cinara cedri]
MASFKNLIFFALVVCTFAATQETETVREKKHAYIATAPAPVLAYSVPGAYPYHYAPVPYVAAAAKAYAPYPAKAYAPYPAIAAYAAYPTKTYAAPGVYADDDGSYWPGKYQNTAAYAYPAAYHY